MARREIVLPNTFHFSTNYTVVFSDINRANHLGADRVLAIALEAQIRFLNSLGMDGSNASDANDNVIMAHSEIQYISEMHHGDDLEVEIQPGNFSDKSVDLFYRFTNKTKDAEAARLRTSILFFDYVSNKVISVPEEFKSKFT